MLRAGHKVIVLICIGEIYLNPESSSIGDFKEQIQQKGKVNIASEYWQNAYPWLFFGELLEMAKASQKLLLTPAASYFGEGRKKRWLIEVAKKHLKKVAKGQGRRSPGLVAFLFRRQAFPRAHCNPTAAPTWDLRA